MRMGVSVCYSNCVHVLVNCMMNLFSLSLLLPLTIRLTLNVIWTVDVKIHKFCIYSGAKKLPNNFIKTLFIYFFIFNKCSQKKNSHFSWKKNSLISNMQKAWKYDSWSVCFATYALRVKSYWFHPRHQPYCQLHVFCTLFWNDLNSLNVLKMQFSFEYVILRQLKHKLSAFFSLCRKIITIRKNDKHIYLN